MPPDSGTGLSGFIERLQRLLFPLLIVTSILVIIAPLPAVVMDVLLACNVTAAVLILLTTVYVRKPLDFSVFPAILLGTTLARLVLNVASTRLILTRGATEKTAAAGEVIQAFGEFVAGDKIAVGLILFCILVAIQFLVITKGSGRISEVAARFFLDGMPGKQMAIDADLNAGSISQEIAKQRREEIVQQADFYGAMDGASKFVRGDAIAGIVITLINIAGGLYIGIFEHGMGAGEAAEVFTKLTIGDGLVTQIPGFLISLAAGLIVTRSSVDSDLPKDVVSQLLRHPEAMILSAGFLTAMAFTGLPMIPMLSLATGCLTVGLMLRRTQAAVEAAEVTKAAEPPKEETKPTEPEDRLEVVPLVLELGPGLMSLVDIAEGGDLLASVTQLRHAMAAELGLLIESVRVRDNLSLPKNEYSICIRDMEVARAKVWPNQLMAINPGSAQGSLPGIETTEPVQNRQAFWIEHHFTSRAELAGYRIIDPQLAVIMHLSEMIRQHAPEILTRQDLHDLIAKLNTRAPDLIKELNPDHILMSQVHQVLKNLLSERVPIRDLETILQTIIDNAGRGLTLTVLTEYVRTSLARTICGQYRDLSRKLPVITIDPGFEDYLKQKMDFDNFGVSITLSPVEQESLIAALKVEMKKLTDIGQKQVLLTTSPQIRASLRQLTRRTMPRMAVLCINEVTSETNAIVRGVLKADALQPKPAPGR